MFCPVKGASQPQISSSRELGLLLGLSSSLDYPLRPREHLALLGLVASPMQMVWIYDHLRNNFARACDLPPVPSPLEWLRAYQRELLHQVQDLFRETDQPAALAYTLELWAQFCDHRDSGMASRSGGGFIVLMHYLILLLAFLNLLLALRLPRFCFCGLQAQL
jgi:hypothetical protein